MSQNYQHELVSHIVKNCPCFTVNKIKDIYILRVPQILDCFCVQYVVSKNNINEVPAKSETGFRDFSDITNTNIHIVINKGYSR